MNAVKRFHENKAQTSAQFTKYEIVGIITIGLHFLIITLPNETVLRAYAGREGSSENGIYLGLLNCALILPTIAT